MFADGQAECPHKKRKKKKRKKKKIPIGIESLGKYSGFVLIPGMLFFWEVAHQCFFPEECRSLVFEMALNIYPNTYELVKCTKPTFGCPREVGLRSV